MTTGADVSLYATTAQAAVDNAQRNGLVWRLIPGTVQFSGSGIVSLILDGDDTTLSSAQNLLAPGPSIGDRVMVLVVPPQGNYVIGYYGAPPEVAGIRDNVSSILNSGAISAETVTLTSNFVTLKDGRAYRIVWAQRLDHSAAQQVFVRVRITDISGTQVSFWQFQVTAIAANYYYYEFRVKRLTGAGDTTINFVQTLQASAGTTTARGSADTVRYLEIWDCGPETMFADAFVIP